MSQYFKTSAPRLRSVTTFQKVIEEIETFSLEDQEILLDILNKRLAEQKRSQLLKEVTEVRAEYIASLNELCHRKCPLPKSLSHRRGTFPLLLWEKGVGG